MWVLSLAHETDLGMMHAAVWATHTELIPISHRLLFVFAQETDLGVLYVVVEISIWD